MTDTIESLVHKALCFRAQHDEIEIGGLNRGGLPTAKIKDPMRLDKFLRAKVINEAQYAAGFYFATLYAATHKSEISLSAYSGLPQEAFAQRIFREMGIIGKIASADLYNKIFRLMTPHLFRVAFQVCVNEMSLSDIASCFKIRKDKAKPEIRASLDELGVTIEQAREEILKSFDIGNQK